MFTWVDKLSPPVQIALGVVMMLLGVSFTYKAFLAIIKGQMIYWEGFLPFTMISPFTLHLPVGKNTLVKKVEGLWIHLIMGPIFMIVAILFLGAGADFAGLPGTDTVNWVLSGGKATQEVTFDRHNGWRFPMAYRVGPTLYKLFTQNVGMKSEDRLYDSNQGSLNDAMRH